MTLRQQHHRKRISVDRILFGLTLRSLELFCWMVLFLYMSLGMTDQSIDTLTIAFNVGMSLTDDDEDDSQLKDISFTTTMLLMKLMTREGTTTTSQQSLTDRELHSKVSVSMLNKMRRSPTSSCRVCILCLIISRSSIILSKTCQEWPSLRMSDSKAWGWVSLSLCITFHIRHSTHTTHNWNWSLNKVLNIRSKKWVVKTVLIIIMNLSYPSWE